jgi:metal-dependent amidase/aminoacylase/carboxypeptidase family protein
MSIRLKAQADALRAVRHDLHPHAELAFEERRTVEIVAHELGALGRGRSPRSPSDHRTRNLDHDLGGFRLYAGAIPGCYFMLGNGNAELQPMLDSPDYDFNDELRVPAAAMLGRLNERFLANA